MSEVIIKQLVDNEGNPIAGLTPEEAVYDQNGVRLSNKIGNMDGQVAQLRSDLSEIEINKLDKSSLSSSIDLDSENNSATSRAIKLLNDKVEQVKNGGLEDGSIELPKLSTTLAAYIGSGGSVTNQADDDDLENIIINGVPVIREKTTKTYNPETYSGMGRVILRKNMVNGVNVLTQEMIDEANTIYIIQYDYNLNDSTITIPNNCILKFEGGSLKNGIINGNNTIIDTQIPNILSSDVRIEGTWLNENVLSLWFNDEDDSTEQIKSLLNLCRGDIKTNLYLQKKIYKVTQTIDSYIFNIPSDTYIYNYGIIELQASTQNEQFLFCIINKKNVTFDGGEIIGNAELVNSFDSDRAHAFRIVGSDSVNIINTKIQKFLADGINLEYTDNSNIHNTNIIIDNDILDSNGRQGISISDAVNITISNSLIQNTYTIKPKAPGAGIDIEPTYSGAKVEEIVIDNCIFNNNRWNISIALFQVTDYGNIYISNCKGDNNTLIAKADYDGSFIYIDNCKFSLFAESSEIRSFKNLIVKNSETKLKTTNLVLTNFNFENCNIESIDLLNGGSSEIIIYNSIIIKRVKVLYGNISLYSCNLIPDSINFLDANLYHCNIKIDGYVRLSTQKDITWRDCIISTTEQTITADFGIITLNEGAKITLIDCNFKASNNPRFLFRGYYSITGCNVVLDGGTYFPINRANVLNPLKCTLEIKSGFKYYDIDKKKTLTFDATSWVDASGEKADILKKGTFAAKQIPNNIGFQYFNTDTNKMIIWDGSKWWNPDGTEATL